MERSSRQGTSQAHVDRPPVRPVRTTIRTHGERFHAPKEAPGHGRPALALRGLTRRFGSLAAVSGLDLEVRSGELLGLLGPNGAGKTTTIRMITGLLAPSTGQVLLRGRPLTPADHRLRRDIGLCPQENVFYPELTIRENLDYAGALYRVPRHLRRQRAAELIAGLGLQEKAKVRADRLSGGMKRRLTIALALIHDPPIVVFDEPEAGLDPQTRVAVRAFIKGLAGRKTILLTSHNMDEVERLADRVAIVDKGRLIALGSVDELRARLGDGDTLEMHVEPSTAPVVAKALTHTEWTVTHDGGVVTVRGLRLAHRVPALASRAAATGADIRDLRFRGNTLEDVFIHLTGRRLRE